LAKGKGLPRSETEALAKRLSEYFGEEQGLSSPDVSFLQVYLLDVIPSPPNAMRGIGQREELRHIRSAIYRAWRIPSLPEQVRKQKVSAIMEDLFNKRIPPDTPEPLRRWLEKHGWGGEPLELPQGIEFEGFGENFIYIMREFGMPTIRSWKQEYDKMEQIIAKYFQTNGRFSQIRDTVLTALEEMVSAGEANFVNGITNGSRLFAIEDGRVVFRSDYQEQLDIAIAGLRQAEPVLHFIDNDHLAGFVFRGRHKGVSEVGGAGSV
jgi:hypothetical protein